MKIPEVADCYLYFEPYYNSNYYNSRKHFSENSNSFLFVAIPILYKIECFFGFDSWNFFLFNQFDLDRNWKIGIILSACEDYQFQYRVLEDLVKGNKDKRKIKMHFTHKFPYRARNSTKKTSFNKFFVPKVIPKEI